MVYFYLFLDFLKAFFISFLIILILYEIIRFFGSLIKFYLKDKKKNFNKFWKDYKFLTFKNILLGSFIKI